MEEPLTMTTRELDRLRVIRHVLEHRMTWPQAAAQLGLCRRQIGYLCARVRAEGHRGIIHRLRGRPSNHRLAPGVVAQAVHLVQTRYPDFGPTFANEKLRAVHDLRLSTFALRQGLITAGVWHPRRLRVVHRSWRPRRACVGELIQLDGSDHEWLEGRGPRCVLLLYIDDATSRLRYAEFVPSEDTDHLFRCTQTYLEQQGRPVAFYVDKDSIYRINRQATIEEQLRDTQPLTQFTRAMAELNIQVLAAHSPQAKGRVERSFQTHQDRLVKELRLAGISTRDAANRFLTEVYLPAHNARFAVAPAAPTDAHRPLLTRHRLAEILSWRSERTLLNDFTLRYESQWFQVLREQPVRVRPGVRITVERRLDGSLHLRFRERYLACAPIPKPVRQPVVGVGRLPRRRATALRPSQPSPAHPWKRRRYQTMLSRV
jgi:hypothetical protein